MRMVLITVAVLALAYYMGWSDRGLECDHENTMRRLDAVIEKLRRHPPAARGQE